VGRGLIYFLFLLSLNIMAFPSNPTNGQKHPDNVEPTHVYNSTVGAWEKYRAHKAQQAEVNAGIDDEKFVTSLGLQSKKASETAYGIIRMATSTESSDGVRDDIAMSPKSFAEALAGNTEGSTSIVQQITNNLFTTPGGSSLNSSMVGRQLTVALKDTNLLYVHRGDEEDLNTSSTGASFFSSLPDYLTTSAGTGPFGDNCIQLAPFFYGGTNYFYFDIRTTNFLKPIGENHVFEFWMYCPTLAQDIIIQGTGSAIAITNTTIGYSVGGVYVGGSTVAFTPNGSWRHIAVTTRDDGGTTTRSLYVDGARVATGSGLNPSTNTNTAEEVSYFRVQTTGAVPSTDIFRIDGIRVTNELIYDPDSATIDVPTELPEVAFTYSILPAEEMSSPIVTKLPESIYVNATEGVDNADALLGQKFKSLHDAFNYLNSYILTEEIFVVVETDLVFDLALEIAHPQGRFINIKGDATSYGSYHTITYGNYNRDGIVINSDIGTISYLNMHYTGGALSNVGIDLRRSRVESIDRVHFTLEAGSPPNYGIKLTQSSLQGATYLDFQGLRFGVYAWHASYVYVGTPETSNASAGTTTVTSLLADYNSTILVSSAATPKYSSFSPTLNDKNFSNGGSFVLSK
jgi:hypothetical protein